MLLLILLLLVGQEDASVILRGFRLVIGGFFILFVPGYSLLAVIFPKKDQIGFLERLSISAALSMAILAIMALILDRLPWGISLWPIVIFLTGFSLIMSLFAMIRRYHSPLEEKGLLPVINIRQLWMNLPLGQKLIIGIFLLVSILGLSFFPFSTGSDSSHPPYTEFYMLSSAGVADLYPSGTGGDINVKLGIANFEKTSQEYTILVLLDGRQFLWTDSIPLQTGQRWENYLSFTLPEGETVQSVEYQLFRRAETAPYRTIRLEIQSP